MGGIVVLYRRGEVTTARKVDLKKVKTLFQVLNIRNMMLDAILCIASFCNCVI